MTHFLLVRHGTTGANGHMLAGWMNGVRLNEAGRAEVRSLGERLAGVRVDAVCSSPLDRTRETAALLAATLGVDPEACGEAGEMLFGEWTGRDFEDLDREPAFQRFNAFRSGTRAPGGETMVEVQARMVAGMLRLRAEHPDRVVVVVSHGDVIKAALAYWLGAPLDLFLRLEVAPASVSTVVLDEHAVRVLGVNDTGNVPAPTRK